MHRKCWRENPSVLKITRDGIIVIDKDEFFLCFSALRRLGCRGTRRSVIWNGVWRGGRSWHAVGESGGWSWHAVGESGQAGGFSAALQEQRGWSEVAAANLEPLNMGTLGTPEGGKKGWRKSDFNCNSLKSTTLTEDLNCSLPSLSLPLSLLYWSLCHLNHSHKIICLRLVALCNIRSPTVSKIYSNIPNVSYPVLEHHIPASTFWVLLLFDWLQLLWHLLLSMKSLRCVICLPFRHAVSVGRVWVGSLLFLRLEVE